MSLRITPTYARAITEFSREEIESALFDIEFEKAKVKAIDCQYSLNGYCQYWKFKPRSHLKKIYMRFAGGDYALPVYIDLPPAGR